MTCFMFFLKIQEMLLSHRKRQKNEVGRGMDQVGTKTGLHRQSENLCFDLYNFNNDFNF